MTDHLHLAVALDGAGWHPAAWREPVARAGELFTARYWAGLVAEAERGLLDFVTIEDGFGLQSTLDDGHDGRVDQVRGRLDAVLLAASIAPLTSHIGLVPTATTTHTEPFHVAIGIATLDHVSQGRAGWRPQVSPRASDAAHFGRRSFPPLDPAALDERHVRDLFEEAGDAVEVARRLWDSWADDAEIRDVATGRFLDRDKLHYIDFRGRWFSVKGPSITPRPPQGQPVVTALAHARVPYEFAARNADIVYVTPRDRDHAAAIAGEIRGIPGGGGTVRIFADLVVFLGHSAQEAAERKARLDELDGAAYDSDALIFTGTAEELADLLLDWRGAGIEGYRLRPGAVPYDLKAIARGVTAALRRRGAFRHAYEAATLRGLLGLPRPANRYEEASTT
ncbi:alkanesulfonate monooxygenase SsuD/methylene tetrahydromethanopterin reductase-like flavin-dependent oxidoreductase (luciferase family) [Thermocatellispora tengchongensis]|uniref:Alkanesulfonate monooxygenase SsuD/methylene tetrahydromethanopterin reductase-like flavin-dependent oxidoreductase (Luciferase family) n=1 Tax=Thermocatellispora tengchongensis TaxID=1073253 RepID=A0A840PK07_9ACTN|nr:LLM class flavin-dependent oxidoreductase [Thermocatellispora tengchongensis]MBB5138141.1 alkanesulfonate monooxygenase SsuD/methylene tetrahydromethanopterin reductase-like flavin-dependent oxidoreductase (luciferase family) [Thermocatellispora tengchongensis]